MNNKSVSNRATEITLAVLKHNPNCPYCGKEMNENEKLTPTENLDFGYGTLFLNLEKYAPKVKLGHYECWLMAQDNKRKQ